MTKLRVEFDIECDGDTCGNCAHLLTYPGGFAVCRCEKIRLDTDEYVGDLLLAVAAGKARRHPLCLEAETNCSN
jgi:hypothetical protein